MCDRHVYRQLPLASRLASVQPIASGRDADVFAVDAATVLRRYRDGGRRCEPEAAIMEWVRSHGYPVPRVHSIDGPDMVLDWVRGPTMLSSISAGTTTPDDAGGVLADLHSRLHALPPPPRPGVGGVIRHLDLHPDNVIESSTGPVVIDWRNSDIGPASVDVAVSAVIIAQVAVSTREDASKAHHLLDAYLAHVGSLEPSSLDQAIAYRSADSNMSCAEVALLRSVAELLQRRG
jgi:aminoglycoside phosphotransferase (APT) family kinase protein